MSLVSLALALGLVSLAVLRRPPFAALTVLWQLRAPLALAGLAVAGAAVAHAALAASQGVAWSVVEALTVALAAALVLARGALERAHARRRRAPEGPHGSLHVVTHNCGLHRSDPQRVAEFLADCGADVLALQELEPAHERALADALGGSLPYRVMHPTGIDGLGLASRFPIRKAELVQRAAAHPYLVAELDAPGGPLRIVVFHPPAALAVVGRKHAAVADLAELAREAAAHAPAILLGDLNSTEATEAHDVFTRAGLVDVFRAVGRGAGVTFPVPFKYLGLPVPPLVRIDFVFTTPDLVPRAAEVGPPTTSDHLPLFATLVRRRSDEGALDVSRAG